MSSHLSQSKELCQIRGGSSEGGESLRDLWRDNCHESRHASGSAIMHLL